jgi:hypothetical protein
MVFRPGVLQYWQERIESRGPDEAVGLFREWIEFGPDVSIEFKKDIPFNQEDLRDLALVINRLEWTHSY